MNQKMESNQEWPFDQAPNVAAISTRQIVELNYPIRQVVHYNDDHSWAFLCGTTEDENDYKLIHMEDILILDESLRSIANLPPGWSAWRENTKSAWERIKDSE